MDDPYFIIKFDDAHPSGKDAFALGAIEISLLYSIVVQDHNPADIIEVTIERSEGGINATVREQDKVIAYLISNRRDLIEHEEEQRP